MDFNWPSYIFGFFSAIVVAVVTLLIYSYLDFKENKKKEEERREEELKLKLAEVEEIEMRTEVTEKELEVLKQENAKTATHILEDMPDDSTVH